MRRGSSSHLPAGDQLPGWLPGWLPAGNDYLPAGNDYQLVYQPLAGYQLVYQAGSIAVHAILNTHTPLTVKLDHTAKGEARSMLPTPPLRSNPLSTHTRRTNHAQLTRPVPTTRVRADERQWRS